MSERVNEKIESSVSTDERGVRTLFEHRRWQNRSSFDELRTFSETRTSRPIRDGETPEQAAADSMSFGDYAQGKYTAHYLFKGPTGGWSQYLYTFPDGSRATFSISRPDLVHPGKSVDAET